MRVHLIRHPKPINGDGVCYGRTDLPVEPAMMQVAAKRAKHDLPERVHRVVSSPLQRCATLAAAIDENYITDPRLTEIDFGQWEAMPWEDIDRAAFDWWTADYVTRRPPDGESWGDVRDRVAGFLDEIRVESGRSASADQTLVVVSHAGVMRSLLSMVLAMPMESTWRIHLPFDSWVEVEVAADAQYDRLIAMHS